MRISNIKKEASYNSFECRITIEITISAEDLAQFDYTGFDMLPDEVIPDMLLALGRMYKNRIKQGKIKQIPENRLSTMPGEAFSEGSLM